MTANNSSSVLLPLAIEPLRIDQNVRDRLKLAVFERAEEAAAPPRVARHARLIDEQEQRIAVAIELELDQPLRLARALALAPERVPRAREVVHLARRKRLLDRLAIHEGRHQDLARVVGLRNRRHEPVGAELDGLKQCFVHRYRPRVSKACLADLPHPVTARPPAPPARPPPA